MKISREGIIVIQEADARLSIQDFVVDCEGENITPEVAQRFLLDTVVTRLASAIIRCQLDKPTVRYTASEPKGGS